MCIIGFSPLRIVDRRTPTQPTGNVSRCVALCDYDQTTSRRRGHKLTSFPAVGIERIQRRLDGHFIHIDYNRIRIQLTAVQRGLVCDGGGGRANSSGGKNEWGGREVRESIRI